MNPRQIVCKTLDFQNPKRVAHSFEPSDIIYCTYQTKTHATDWEKIDDKNWRRLDEWGNTWARVDSTSKGEVLKGVLDNLDDLGKYDFPDFSNPLDYELAGKIRHENPDRYLLGGIPGFPFNIARKLRRLDKYLMDIVLEPDRIHLLHDRIEKPITQMIRSYASAGADAILFCEDWGTQQQLLISPQLWLKEFFPRFQRLCTLAHESSLKVWMHSCGRIEAIIPHLIKAGIDVLQFDQPDLHGLDNLAAYQLNAGITFWCPVDIQKTLQTRDEHTIRNAAKQMLDKLWKARGGFIAGYYQDNDSIGLDPKWQAYACDEFKTHGVEKNYR
ncbi:MAG: uroporphyrinogen decarboxylase family protein [Planctomycetota bacterium]